MTSCATTCRSGGRVRPSSAPTSSGTRALWVIERMLERMFVGDPAGSYDRILDFSTAVTGTSFFAPTRGFLDALAD